MIYLILIPAMSLLNRVRGGLFNVNTWIIGIFFGILSGVITASYVATFIGLGLYMLGESMGWGKWIGSIGERVPKYDEYEGIYNGIHWLANRIVDEHDDYLNYSRIALAIRGWYWFAPLLTMYAFYGVIGWVEATVLSVLIAGAFPLSVEIGRIIKKGMYWEASEYVYGAFHGILFIWLLA